MLSTLDEDVGLRMLAWTKLGQTVLMQNGTDVGFLSDEEQEMLRLLLLKVDTDRR